MKAELRALCSCALTACVLLWLPLSIPWEIDGRLLYMTRVEMARDLVLLVVLLAALASAFAGLVWLLGVVLRGPLGPDRAALVAWICLLLPLLALCFRQLVATSGRWLQLSTGVALDLPSWSHIHSPVLVAIALILAFGTLTIGPRRMVSLAIPPLAGGGRAAITVVLIALAALPAIAFSTRQVLPDRRSNAPAMTGVQPPSIILVSIDTVAAVDAAVCGDGPTMMPNLRRLADRSTCFSRFYASSNFTVPTTLTMETGLLPWNHLANQLGAKAAPAVRSDSIGAVLQAHGYATRSISANLLASPIDHGTWRGYDSATLAHTTSVTRTVQDLLATFRDSSLPQLTYSMFSFLGGVDVYLHGTRNPLDPMRVYDAAEPFIGASKTRPTFLWLHTWPPHAPYLPPASTRHRLLQTHELEQWREQKAEGRYEAQEQGLVDKHRLRYRESMLGADEALGRLLSRLEQAGELDRSVIIVTADHGESFDHGYLGHSGNLLFESLIRVPLVVHLPRQARRLLVDMPVSQADLLPTILELAGVPGGAALEGRSLVPALKGQAMPPALVYAMSLQRWSRFERLTVGDFAVIDERYKLIHHLPSATSELYDLVDDDGERRNLASSHPETVSRLLWSLRTRLRAAEAARGRHLVDE